VRIFFLNMKQSYITVSLKGLSLLGLSATCVFFGGVAAKAIDIGAGPLKYVFTWDDPAGPPASADQSFEVTVGVPSIVSVALEDAFAVGDEFELLLNGNSLTASSSGTSADGSDTTNPLLGAGLSGGPYFYGIWNNVALDPGLNIFSIKITAYAPPFTSGGALAYFSPVTVPVTVPGPLPLLGAMTAFGYSRRLRAKVKSSSTISPD
jgi:hypothetical protein